MDKWAYASFGSVSFIFSLFAFFDNDSLINIQISNCLNQLKTNICQSKKEIQNCLNMKPGQSIINQSLNQHYQNSSWRKSYSFAEKSNFHGKKILTLIGGGETFVSFALKRTNALVSCWCLKLWRTDIFCCFPDTRASHWFFIWS